MSAEYYIFFATGFAAALIVLTVAAVALYRSSRLRTKLRELSTINDALKNEIQLRKTAEVDADRMRRSAELMSGVKDEFLATLSHELRTPANVILGFSQLLRSGELRPTETAEAADAIYRNAEAQNLLINQMLDAAKIVTGQMNIKHETVRLDNIARQVIESCRLSAGAKRIHYTATLPRFAMQVRGEEGRIRQILWNLLSNAIKFTPVGGSVSVSLENEEGHAKFIVEDNGQGISPEFVTRVFERFTQEDGTSTRRHGGMGLGLAVARQLAELHGGTVTVSSRGRGLGSTFVLRLPRYTATLEQGAVLEGLNVLIVDDAPDILGLVTTILQKHGARVATATSAEQALSRIRLLRPDVLLSDIGMPGEDGYSLIRKVRQLGDDWTRQTPAAALTAFSAEEDRRRAVEAGFQMHIPKPVDSHSLLKAVQSLARAGGN